MSLLDLRTTGKWFVLSLLVGLVAGSGAIAFQVSCQWVLHHGLIGFAGYSPAEPAGEASWFVHDGSATFSPLILLVVLAVGGLLSGLIVYTFAPEAEGHGTDAAIEAFHHKRGYIRPRIPLVKMLASAITLGTGGSGGREGPIAQIGAGFGSFLATRLRLSARDRRILLAAGMGAGVGAIFRAPLAGALFSAEILYREEEFESDVIMPTAMASIISYSLFSLSLPLDQRFVPLFGDGLDFHLGSSLELLPLSLLAMVLSLAAILYVKVFYGTHNLFSKLPLPPHFRPILGAVLTGLVALGLYYASDEDMSVLAVLSTGYGAIQSALDSGTEITIGILLLIAAGKILTTSLTIGSGGSGGVFGPSMVIGGCLGGAVGEFLHRQLPEIVKQPHAYVIVGMAGFFAGCAHAPISTLIMVSEMTGDYKLLLPVMWVSTLCFLFCRRWTIYIKQVPTRLESPAHSGDFIIDLLGDIKVKEVFREDRELRFVPLATTMDEIVHLISDTHQSYFPVVDGEDRMVGIFSTRDIRAFIYDERISKVAIARDIMESEVLTLELDDDLNRAMRRFTQRNIDELPVMDPEDEGKVLGMLRRKDVIAFYNERLDRLKKGVDHEDHSADPSRDPRSDSTGSP